MIRCAMSGSYALENFNLGSSSGHLSAVPPHVGLKHSLEVFGGKVTASGGASIVKMSTSRRGISYSERLTRLSMPARRSVSSSQNCTTPLWLVRVPNLKSYIVDLVMLWTVK